MKLRPLNENPPELRQYQRDAITCAVAAMVPGSRSMLVLPTGAGKSIVIAAIAAMFPDQQILIITPRVRLVEQLRPMLGEHGVLSASLGHDLGDQDNLLIGTYQTIVNSAGMVPPFLIVIDECHLVPPGSRYGDLIAKFPNAAVIGLTATPYRGTEKITECDIGWKQIYSISILDLIEQKRLVPPRSMATLAPSVRGAESSQTLLSLSKRIVRNLVTAVRKEDRKKCLVFCVNIDHAIKLARLLEQAGEVCVSLVHSGQDGLTQDEMFSRFKDSSQRAWLVNVSLVSIGIDIPSIDCIAIVRDVSSFALLVQIIGRGLRWFEGKQDCLVYDFGQGTERFGFIDEPTFTSTGSGSSRGGTGTKACPKCGTLTRRSALVCQHCCHSFNPMMMLSETSRSTQLLTQEYVIAEYQRSAASRDARGIWLIQHELTSGGQCLRAITSTINLPEGIHQTHRAGARLVVKRLAGDLVLLLPDADRAGRPVA